MTSHVLRVKPPAVEATPDLGPAILGDPGIVYNLATREFLCHGDGQFHAPEDLKARQAKGESDRVGLFMKNSQLKSLTKFYDCLNSRMTGDEPDDPDYSIAYLRDDS